MARTVERIWEPSLVGTSRRDRGGCRYQAYLPDPLAGWPLSLSGEVAADLDDAQAAIGRLNATGGEMPSDGGMARLLLRSEAVASSWIEGLAVGPRRLIEAEALAGTAARVVDRVAVEILANIAAMRSALDVGVAPGRVTLEHILEIHRTLMVDSRHPHIAGRLREVQNWMGAQNPCRAAFVPPPPEEVPDLMADLVAYINGDDHPPLVQAAVTHAQFETIHPFVDGNGRTGRALIHVVLRRRGLAPRQIPPVSVVLASRSDDYIAGLTACRHLSEPDGPQRSIAAGRWLSVFAEATLRACAEATTYAARVDALRHGWHVRLGRVRRGSALDRLIDILPGTPLVSVESAARLIDRSTVRTGAAITQLVDAGILRQRDLERRRYRVFEAPDAIDLMVDLERQAVAITQSTSYDRIV